MSGIEYSTILASLESTLVATLNIVLPLMVSVLLCIAGAYVVLAVAKLAINSIRRLGSAR